jgi:DNA-binding winged helix-turn-helix (wHTH) protein/Tol biopolymer transport system component
MNEFFVGQFRVDMGRSQIVDQDAIVSMEPRVLQVLLILAEHQGEVVTHQQILDKVWKDVSVAPNTLQRCITQLRKAMGDSAKDQQVIETHPKVGYSLIANVSWQQHLTSGHNSTPPLKPGTREKIFNGSYGLLALGAFAGILVAILLLVLNSVGEGRANSSLPLSKLTALTTTDKKEYAPTFSPDGRYIAFQRYVGFCENELWAKDLQKNREYLLTKTSGIYGTPSWSPNGQYLAFSNVTHCSMTSDFQGCRDIRTLNFALAKSEPQEPLIVMPCNGEDYRAAVWIENERIAFFEENKDESQRVLGLNLKDGAVETLYSSRQIEFDSLSYSRSLNTLAITQHNLELESSMVLLDLKDNSSHQVVLNPPENYASIVSWYAEWHPTEARLIAARGNSVFEIDTNGEFTQHSVPTMQAIADPVFHPNGESIVASMGIFDKDIQLVEWEENIELVKNYKIETIHRSIVTEREAKFEPHGNRIAYISETSGLQQIWLTEINQITSSPISEPMQLSQLSDNPQIHAFVWSYDGRLIIALVDGQLRILNLDGQMTNIDTDYRVLDIYQAHQEDEVLLEILEGQQEKIISLNIKSMHRRDYYQGEVSWAQLTSSGELYISNKGKRIFQWKNNIAQPLANTQSLRFSAIFLSNNNQLLLNDDDNVLWLYDLDSASMKKLFRINQPLKHIDSIDFEQRKLLITTVASTKKEIVLFHR